LLILKKNWRIVMKRSIVFCLTVASFCITVSLALADTGSEVCKIGSACFGHFHPPFCPGGGSNNFCKKIEGALVDECWCNQTSRYMCDCVGIWY
jgi:hypothetical protein